ncbi:hypothetical protein GCM10007173_02740 [Glutamicibacter ardleyensis]|uniref:Uncharacterized protein n=1 Tax=Glutamicibacter ardleyensis TaxID=225894 RepID=A0ABQ2D679_9MICC|nr:hypothetical protein GCM10007173_02740 [Glutamicibacter ardleyensis]
MHLRHLLSNLGQKRSEKAKARGCGKSDPEFADLAGGDSSGIIGGAFGGNHKSLRIREKCMTGSGQRDPSIISFQKRDTDRAF